jgi:hypothetical protein
MVDIGDSQLTVTALLSGRRLYADQAMLSIARGRHSFLLLKIETTVVKEAIVDDRHVGHTWKADHFCKVLNENLDGVTISDISYHFYEWPTNALESYIAEIKQPVWIDTKYLFDQSIRSFRFITSVFAVIDDLDVDGPDFAKDYEQAVFLNKLSSGLE